MSLFIAITVPHHWKDQMAGAVEYLQSHSHTCAPIRRENFHLTLDFLGDIPRDCTPEIFAAMDRVKFQPLTLTSGKIHVFPRRDEGDIWWLGLEPNDALLELQARLSASLTEAGFSVPQREFIPHLTLARDVLPGPEISPEILSRLIPPMEYQVDYVTLYHSEAVRDWNYYTPLHRTMLKAPIRP